jgi:intracellular multiplication protein IcmL
MAEDALELIRLRNNFYRDNYRRVLLVMLILMIANVVLASALTYIFINRPAPVYFATTADGKLTQLTPLHEPLVSRPELLQWANQAVISVFDFNFVNWRAQLQSASEYFTPEGWKSFNTELDSAKTLDLVLKQKLNVSAVATGAPVVADEGTLGDRHAWRVTMPILITYESANQKITQPMIVTLLIARVSTLDNPKGIAIAQFVGTETRGATY